MEPRDSFQCCELLEHDLARVLLDQVFHLVGTREPLIRILRIML
jgi:hypothetical protein